MSSACSWTDADRHRSLLRRGIKNVGPAAEASITWRLCHWRPSRRRRRARTRWRHASPRGRSTGYAIRNLGRGFRARRRHGAQYGRFNLDGTPEIGAVSGVWWLRRGCDVGRSPGRGQGREVVRPSRHAFAIEGRTIVVATSSNPVARRPHCTFAGCDHMEQTASHLAARRVFREQRIGGRHRYGRLDAEPAPVRHRRSERTGVSPAGTGKTLEARQGGMVVPGGGSLRPETKKSPDQAGPDHDASLRTSAARAPGRAAAVEGGRTRTESCLVDAQPQRTNCTRW